MARTKYWEKNFDKAGEVQPVPAHTTLVESKLVQS